MPPRSIKFRLLLSFLVSMTVILAVGGVAMYKVIERHLRNEHDDLLRQRLLFYETAANVQRGRGNVSQIYWHLTLPEWKRISNTGNPDMAMGWRVGDSEPLFRSPVLHTEGGAHEVPRLPASGDSVSFADWTTWDGRPARLCTRIFLPAKDSPDLADMPTQVVVGRDLLGLNRTLTDLRWFLVKTGLGVMAAVLIVSSYIIRRGVKPLVTLAGQIERRPAVEDGEPFSLPGAPTELQPVVGRLNALMDRVDEAIEHERQFASNAAHELRNPLAAIRSTIEVTLNRTRSAEEYEEALDSIWHSQQGMQRIVDHLLLLARLESGHRHSDFLLEPVLLSKLLKKQWSHHFDLAHGKQIKVSWHIAEPDGEVRLPVPLMGIVISNMLDNAVNYTPAGGAVAIHGSAGSGVCCIRVENTNPGLSQEQVAQSFTAFWRGDPNASGHRGNAGIGLALCRRIAETLGGRMEGRITLEGLVAYECIVPLLPGPAGCALPADGPGIRIEK